MKRWRQLLIGVAAIALLLLPACNSVRTMDEAIILPKPIPCVYASCIDADPPDNDRPYWKW